MLDISGHFIPWSELTKTSFLLTFLFFSRILITILGKGSTSTSGLRGLNFRISSSWSLNANDQRRSIELYLNYCLHFHWICPILLKTMSEFFWLYFYRINLKWGQASMSNGLDSRGQFLKSQMSECSILIFKTRLHIWRSFFKTNLGKLWV